jgi:hypothetical protein
VVDVTDSTAPPFGMVPARAFSDRDLKESDLRVLGALCSFRNAETGDCYPYVRSIAQRAGLGTSSTREALRRLKRFGYIDVERRWNEWTGAQIGNYYVILDLEGVTGSERFAEANELSDATPPSSYAGGPPPDSPEAPLQPVRIPPSSLFGGLENRQGFRQEVQTNEHLGVHNISNREDQEQEPQREQEHEDQGQDLNTWRLEQVKAGRALSPNLSDEELARLRDEQRAS